MEFLEIPLCYRERSSIQHFQLSLKLWAVADALLRGQLGYLEVKAATIVKRFLASFNFYRSLGPRDSRFAGERTQWMSESQQPRFGLKKPTGLMMVTKKMTIM